MREEKEGGREEAREGGRSEREGKNRCRKERGKHFAANLGKRVL